VLDIFGRPFEAGCCAGHPLLQDDVLAVLLHHSQHEPATAPVLREYCQQHAHRHAAGRHQRELRMAMAEDACCAAAR
jgi:hypothetical protein